MTRLLLAIGLTLIGGTAWGQTTAFTTVVLEREQCLKLGATWNEPARECVVAATSVGTIQPGTFIGATMPAPAFQAQLDRIEAMLKAICARQADPECYGLSEVTPRKSGDPGEDRR